MIIKKSFFISSCYDLFNPRLYIQGYYIGSRLVNKMVDFC